jgi:hypothetical protein
VQVIVHPLTDTGGAPDGGELLKTARTERR